MHITVSVMVQAPVERVWKTVSDIEHAADVISGIEKIEVLKKGDEGMTGLTWKETRVMYGKVAEEIMTVTEAVENSYYLTRAESHGSRYTSRIAVTAINGQTELSMGMEAVPLTIAAKVIWGLTGFLFKGSTRKALEKDLADIKECAEKTD